MLGGSRERRFATRWKISCLPGSRLPDDPNTTSTYAIPAIDEPRTAVVGYRKSGDIFVVIASANGAAANPAWYVNLLANPTATVEVGPEKLNVRARTVKGKERDRLAKLVEYLEAQQNTTSRTIPVVALESVKSRKT